MHGCHEGMKMIGRTKLAVALSLCAMALAVSDPGNRAEARTLLRANQSTDQPKVSYRTIRVGDLDIFYREAGPKNAPTLLLLHGFPTSSQMFRTLIPKLADRYHLVAPDYPGYGYSSMPSRD